MGSSQPKFNTIYSKIFKEGIIPDGDGDPFYSNLLGLQVNRPFLEAQLNRLSKEICLGGLKVRQTL